MRKASVVASLIWFAAPSMALAETAGMVSMTHDELVKALAAARVGETTPAVRALVDPKAMAVDPAAVPDPEIDPGGWVMAVTRAGGARQWLSLIPLLLVGLIAGLRRWVRGAVGAWLATPRGGAVLALVGSCAGALYLAAQLGLTSVQAWLTAAAGILATAYPLFKTIGNLISGGDAPSAGEVATRSDALARASTGAEVAAGRSASSLADEARR